uniref:Replication factor A C-terminal domain-containing protein n=1 Tax=Lactuca sativa TaxID=4236 RepID=A0A9R1XLW0_LACSA|nr:hypothetical protein LSAT_V11C400196770 [Lactuca sativa]
MIFLLVGSIVNIRQNLHTLPKLNHFIYHPNKISKTIVTQCKDARCNNLDFRPITKYMIPINVQDDTGTIRLILFDREAKKLLDISAYQLRKIHEDTGDSLELFPKQINVLKNPNFVFLVDITSYNVDNYNNIYTIVKVIEYVSIVFQLESKIELTSIKFVSLDQVSLESDDVLQNVQKSFTPSTVNKSTATSPMKISADLKRNLHDIYDVDCVDEFNSTKSKRKSIREDNPLLVRTMEK